MNAITKTISYSVADLQMAYDLHWSKKQPVRKNAFLIIAVITFLIWLFLDYTGNEPGYSNNDFLAAFKFFFIAYSIICVALHVWWYRTFAKRTAKKLNSIGREFTVTFSTGGIKAANETGSTETLWAAYPEAIMSDQIILLYRNQLLFNYYPRRFFTTEEFETIGNWIKEGVKKVI